MAKKVTTATFIEKAKQKHPDKYDYSKVVYVNAKSKVIIICPVHAEFEQSPSNHLSGYGCIKCAGSYQSTTAEFVEKAKSIHGDQYDYSKVEYIGNKSKVIIICPEHGEFEQIPSSHLRGSGCYECGKNNRCKKRTLTSLWFIKKSKSVHGDKYDYSKVEYVNSQSKVIITCLKHGEFEQRPSSHLSGSGCTRCGLIFLSELFRGNNEKFINNARKAHGYRYDYYKVRYVSDKDKVIIMCHEHGDFEQFPSNHLKGSGCPSCAEYGYQRDKPGSVYVLRSADHIQDVIKVGISNDPKRRYKELTKSTPFNFNVIECFEVDGQRAPEIEKEAHRLGDIAGLTGFDGATEWFKYNHELIEKVRLLSVQ